MKEVVDVWETPFYEGMLSSGDNIVVNCPTEELERELASVLDAAGFLYPRDVRIPDEIDWNSFQEEFCYYILANSKTVRRGSKDPAARPPYRNHIKCTFFGTEDFEPADESEFRAFLGI